MSDRPGQDVDLVVRPGFAVMMAGLVVVYGALYAVSKAPGTPPSIPESLNWGAAVTVLVLLGTLLHELGHVTAGIAFGHRWTTAVLNGAGLGVVMEPAPFGWQRVTRSLAGPLVHLLFALPLLATSLRSSSVGRLTVRTPELSIWWIAGVSSVFLAVLNLLPFPGFDGAKVVQGLAEVVSHRRRLTRRRPPRLS